MVYRVVSTKLTEEQHDQLLDECNRQGFTPSSFVRYAVMQSIASAHPEPPSSARAQVVEDNGTQKSPSSALRALLASRRLNDSKK
jgi:hypothetical protein